MMLWTVSIRVAPIGYFQFILSPCFKASLRTSTSYKNEFDELVGNTHFQMHSFTRRLVLTQR